MKRILCALILIVILSGCRTATPQTSTFAGTWITNVGKVDFQQTGNDLTGYIEGYGGGRNDTFKGTVNANDEAAFSTTWFGEFTLVLTGDTFKSKSDELAFCGIRTTKSEELPAGCGFSGKWIVPSKSIFPNGSYMVLKQVGENVTGDIFDENNKSFDSITGKVDWGKGWRMNGSSTKQSEITLNINAAETGFQIIYGELNQESIDQQLCAVRDGQDSAYIMYFICQP
jgi:hypothetical protein